MNQLSQVSQEEPLGGLHNAGEPPLGTGWFELVARQFSRPEGTGGRAIAALMRIVNWIPNRRAIDLLDVAPTDDVLEIGFGPGNALKQLAQLASEGSVTGVDRSGTMFEAATRRNADAIGARRMTLLHGAFEALPMQDASVDRILAVNVLYFVGPLTTALAEAHRVLRPGGSLSIYVTDRSTMEALQFVGRDTRHSFDRASLERALSASVFGRGSVDVRRIWLPFGFRGLVAKVTKTE